MGNLVADAELMLPEADDGDNERQGFRRMRRAMSGVAPKQQQQPCRLESQLKSQGLLPVSISAGGGARRIEQEEELTFIVTLGCWNLRYQFGLRS